MMRAPDLSHLAAALRLARASWGGRGSGEGGQAAPRRRVAVERDGIRIDPRRVRDYLACTGGSALSAGEAVPPVYPALWQTGMALDLLVEGGIPLQRGGMIHLGGEVVQVRPLRPDDRVRCRLELDRADPDAGGTRLTLVGRSWNAAGQLCVEDVMRVLLRGPVGERVRPERQGAGGAADAEWSDLAEWRLGGGHGRRYAAVSGDYNPIHLWRWSAKLFGFERPILHGFCTQAMIAHELVGRRLGGDPAALRRLEITFRAPILLPARALLQISPTPDGCGGRFRLLAPDQTRRPVAEGAWVGRG